MRETAPMSDQNTAPLPGPDDSVTGRVGRHLVGEVWPATEPGTDPVLYGHAELTPSGPVEVRSHQSLTLRYTAGRFGLDDTGAIRIVFRAMGDASPLQTRDAKAPNHVTATSSSGVPLRVRYEGRGAAARPRWKSVTVDVAGGYLREGDVISVILGDTSEGSPGWKMQTIAESGFELTVLADVCAVGHFIPIPDSPAIAIVAGEPVRWVAALPTLRRPGELFSLGLKAEDLWGNPTDLAHGRFNLISTIPVDGLPESVAYELGRRSLAIEGLTAANPGVLRISVVAEDGSTVAESHPLVVREGRVGGYWGDMHGQSGESIGLTTARQYFDFARNCAFLDATGHQANDFQVNNAFWTHLNELTAEFHQPGRFVTLPGYEWSGNTAVGGDRNVYFREEGRQIRRSSHALISDRTDIDTDANDANLLFDALTEANEDCVVYAHVGGRYADIAMAHDPRLETAMEIHSAWGTFEWLLTDGFAMGHRSGVVCNSDGHKGRPGASYPGAATFGAYGGLTCFYAEELSRDGLFECLRRRHHYGTTGTRMHLDVTAAFEGDARVYDRDPRAFDDASAVTAATAMMGDIVQTDGATARVSIEAITHAPIERIELRNGIDVIDTIRPFSSADLGTRIRILWSGAEYRGRGRTTTWKGRATFDGTSIERLEKINIWNHERTVEQVTPDSVDFDTITTGNFAGFDAWLPDGARGELHVSTNHGDLVVDLEAIGLEDIIMDAGGLGRQLKVFRLPDENQHRELVATREVSLSDVGDNPLWVSVFTEDGFQAWSSPMFVFRNDT
jgi:hypothetical protein